MNLLGEHGMPVHYDITPLSEDLLFLKMSSLDLLKTAENYS